MDAAAVLARYDAEIRADPPATPGFKHVWAGGVLRTLGAYNFIGWWRVGAAEAATVARCEAAYFRQAGGARCKVMGHDQPAEFCAALADAGFVELDPQTFMVLDLEAGTPAFEAPPGIEVRAIYDRAGALDMVDVNDAAFGRGDHWSEAQVDALIARLSHPTLRVYVAYDGPRPVSSGRLEFAPGKAFAGLYGGGTRPDYQGRGVYRALVAARAAEARWRGHRYLTVDAKETSRPILQRIGFEPLTTIRDWSLPAA